MTPVNILYLNHSLSKRFLSVLSKEKDFKIFDTVQPLSRIQDVLSKQKKVDIVIVKVEDLQDLHEIKNLIRRGNVRNVVAVGNVDKEIIFGCIKAGIRGFICPDISSNLLKKAIRVINKGEIWFDRKTSSKMFEEFARHITTKEQPDLMECLSNREKEVLHLMSKGYKNRGIAENLCISENTVRNHLSKIYEKLGVEDRINAIILARKIK